MTFIRSYCAFAALLAITCLAQTFDTPQMGVWSKGPVLNRHDLSNDATTAGSFDLNRAGTPAAATFFLGCKGNSSGPPTLEFRVVVPKFNGYDASQISKTGTLVLGSTRRNVALDNFPVGPQIYLVVDASPVEIGLFSAQNSNQKDGLSLLFFANAFRAVVSADLPPQNMTLNAVLDACHIPHVAASPAGPRLDFPAAAAGFPPLHASHPPDEGCRWVPFISQKFGFELLTERCGGGRNDWKLGETAHGIGMSLAGPPDVAFDVFQKPAAQPVETAIREQVILKFKDSPARANCRVLRSAQEELPGWHEYEIQPFGAYAHPKLTKEEENEKDGGPQLCGGLYGGDVSTYFVYNPDLSTTRFFLFYGLSDPLKGQPYDIFSLQFRQATAQ